MKFLLTLSLLLSAFPSRAQTDPAQAVKAALSGKILQVTYHEGGPLYGRKYFVIVRFCRAGSYVSKVETHRTTVLNNEESGGWLEAGTWDVISFHGQAVLRYFSQKSGLNATPAAVLRDGSLWLGDGVSVTFLDEAGC
jgi:hypothetical protein